MKIPIFTLLYILCTSPFMYSSEWKLVWSDEFNVDGAPDPTKWDYEVGFIRNKEVQYYTRDRVDNVRVSQGVLMIEAKEEKFKNPNYKAGSADWRENSEFANYTSGSIHTLGLASFLYGRLEISAKMPKGKRVWPAIWTLGTNIKTVGYPICGEIDINEFYGGTLMTAVCHFADSEGLDRIKPKSISAGASRTHIQHPCEGFHVYAMEWDENEIKFLVDGVPFGTLKTEVAGHASINPYRKPHYLLLNFALTGQGNESIDDGSNTPHLFQIDYVRYFQKK